MVREFRRRTKTPLLFVLSAFLSGCAGKAEHSGESLAERYCDYRAECLRSEPLSDEEWDECVQDRRRKLHGPCTERYQEYYECQLSGFEHGCESTGHDFCESEDLGVEACEERI